MIELQPKRRLLLVDGNNLAWRWAMANAGQQLATSTGIVTTVCFGIIESIMKANETLASVISHNLKQAVEAYYDDVIVCWDARGPVWRHKIYPDYKANRNDEKRKQIKAEVLPHIDIARQFLSMINVRQISVDGLEGDDLISLISNAFKSIDYTITIISGDHDLWQLLDWGKVWQHDGKDTMRDAAWFINEYKMMPHRWSEVKAIEGDDGDNVIGVDGFGEKISVSVVQNVEHINILNVEKLPKIKFLSDKKKNVLADAIANGQIFLNYRLVDLPKSVISLDPQLQFAFHEAWNKLSASGIASVDNLMYAFQTYELRKFISEFKHVVRCLGLKNA